MNTEGGIFCKYISDTSKVSDMLLNLEVTIKNKKVF